MSGKVAYTNESSLGYFLQRRVDKSIIHDERVPGATGRSRPDYRSEKHKLIVEFDGYYHYTMPRFVLADPERDVMFETLGYTTIRIPYFIQLSAYVVQQLFSTYTDDITGYTDFPHGFHAKDVVYPAAFCELGVDRFIRDLRRFPAAADDVIRSLHAAIKIKGDRRLVIPSGLLSLM